MATIGKIRKRSGLLLIVIGGAMVAFILGDLFSSRSIGGQTVPEVGEIAGDPVTVNEFEYRVDAELASLKQVNQTVDEATTTRVRNQIWNEIIRDRIFMPQIQSLGLNVSPEEYDDIRFGSNILDDFKNDPSFKNPETGQFDPARVQQYFVFIQKDYPLLWNSQKRRIIQTRISNKYNNLLKNGIFVNKMEAKEQFMAENKKVDFEFVFKRYTAIPDSLISVSEDDVYNYYLEHKSEPIYKQQESRSISYIGFSIEPSQEDLRQLNFELSSLKSQFETTDNDSSFVVRNSDSRFYRPEIYTKGGLDNATDSLITSSKVGTIVGPYEDAGTMKLSKIVFNGKEDEIHARHILLQSQDGDVESLKDKADSLKKVIKREKNFEEVAKQFSADKGSAAKGGDLDWFGRGVMVKPFEEACYNNKAGKIVVVESQFGVHIIEILEKRPTDKIKLASITRTIEASNQTINKVYDEASEISINADSYEKLEAVSEERGEPLRSAPNVAPGSSFISGMVKPTPVVRWMYKAEQGDVSEPIEIENMIVVACLTNIFDEGEPAFDDVKDRMEREVIKLKKAEIYKEKMTGNNLTTIANNIGEGIENNSGLTFGMSSFGRVGREPEIIGKIMTLPANAVSVPLTGENGIYVVNVTNIQDANAPESLASQKSAIKSRLESSINFAAYNALLEKAEVKDNRHKFF